MIEHVVVPAGPCADVTEEPDGAGTAVWCEESRRRCAQCDGCLGNGRRVLLGHAVPVEPLQCVPMYGGEGFYAWKPVQS